MDEMVPDGVNTLDTVTAVELEMVSVGESVLEFDIDTDRESETMRVTEAVGVEDAEGVGGGVTVLVFETVSVRDFVILRVKDIVFERLSECVLVDASASTTARAMIAVTTGTACHRRGSNIPALF